jgi:hypothetical protein
VGIVAWLFRQTRPLPPRNGLVWQIEQEVDEPTHGGHRGWLVSFFITARLAAQDIRVAFIQ